MYLSSSPIITVIHHHNHHHFPIHHHHFYRYRCRPVYHPHVGLHGRPERELKSMESLQESELSIDPKAVRIEYVGLSDCLILLLLIVHGTLDMTSSYVLS